MSVKQTRWVERKFEFTDPVGIFPCILERFRGTPGRLEEVLSGYPAEILIQKPEGGWSMQEHAGHLFDLEELGERRLREFLERVPVLSGADMKNRKTYEANHNAKPIGEILQQLRIARTALAAKLEELDEVQVGFSSLHPRLNMQMRVVDWVTFMAEHDDHHLARIRGLGHLLKSSSR